MNIKESTNNLSTLLNSINFYISLILCSSNKMFLFFDLIFSYLYKQVDFDLVFTIAKLNSGQSCIYISNTSPKEKIFFVKRCCFTFMTSIHLWISLFCIKSSTFVSIWITFLSVQIHKKLQTRKKNMRSKYIQ